MKKFVFGQQNKLAIVFNIIADIGPATAKEITDALNKEYYFLGCSGNLYPILVHLEKTGHIERKKVPLEKPITTSTGDVIKNKYTYETTGKRLLTPKKENMSFSLKTLSPSRT